MGKKKNKKKDVRESLNIWKKQRNRGDDEEVKKEKKSKKNKKNSSQYPNLKLVHPNLDKKDRKEASKVITKPVDVPKSFQALRSKCNHAGDVITPEEFRQMTPCYAVYTPMLDIFCEVFGEENVCVCESCYDAKVNYALITPEKINEAIAMLYAAANKAVSMSRMKDGEVKDIGKLKSDLSDWAEVAAIVDKIDTAMNAAGANTDEPRKAMNPNDIGNTPFIQ